MIGRSSYCPSYDWPLLIIHLVSSNFSYILVQVSVHGVGNGPDSGGYELTEKWGGDMFSD